MNHIQRLNDLQAQRRSTLAQRLAAAAKKGNGPIYMFGEKGNIEIFELDEQGGVRRVKLDDYIQRHSTGL